MAQFREGKLPPDRLQLIRIPGDWRRQATPERGGFGNILMSAISTLAAFILMAAFLTFLLAPVAVLELVPEALRPIALSVAIVAVALSAIWLLLVGLRQRAASQRASYRSRRA